MATVKEVIILAKKNHVEMPISEQVNGVINCKYTAKEAVSNLVSRRQNLETL